MTHYAPSNTKHSLNIDNRQHCSQTTNINNRQHCSQTTNINNGQHCSQTTNINNRQHCSHTANTSNKQNHSDETSSITNLHRSMNRSQLMEHINQVSFAVDEVKLYLDTHPCDSEALAYFHEMSAHRNDALKQYASAYGPLTVDTADHSCAERWNWINEPWPWQEGGC